jgi:hypothetical protein
MSDRYTDIDGARVGGFIVEKVTSIRGKKEDDKGKLQIVLQAEKDEINTGAFQFGQILSALNVHQEGQQPIVLRLLMPTNEQPNG